ncbi:hypothetical protein MTO96_044393 [Rhipicephalus appendiculatus]
MKNAGKESGCRQAVAPSARPGRVFTRSMRVQMEPQVPPDVSTEFICDVCDRAFATKRGLGVHQTRQGHKNKNEESRATKPPAKTKKSGENDAPPVRGCEGIPERQQCDDQRPLTESQVGRTEEMVLEVSQAPGCEGSREEQEGNVPSEVQAQGTYSPVPAPGVLETAVAHSHADHASKGSVWDGRAGTSVALAPPVRNAAAVCGPAGGNRGASVWRSTGARPKDWRSLPPGLLSDSDSDEEVVPVSYRVATGDHPQDVSSTNEGCLDNASVGTGSASTQPRISSSQVMPTHHVCPECNRAFGTLIGLSQHRRQAHMEEYNAEIDIQRTKPRWHDEEEYLMAVYEVQLRQERVYNLNQRLHQKFPTRTFDAIKSHRRDAGYRKLVEDLQRNQNREPANGHNGYQDELSNVVDAQDASPVDKRAEICDEIRKLTAKPPPKSYQACRLWEIAKRFLSGERVSMELNAYLRESFSSDEVRRNAHAPSNSGEESRRKKKKKEYAKFQNLYKKDRSRCIRQILDDTGVSQVEDPDEFLEEWRTAMEAPVQTAPLSMEPRPHSFRPFDPRSVITASDIKYALPARNSASGPDGFSAKRLHTVPMIILRVLINLIMLQRRLPLVLCNARTIFIPKVPGASTANLHRPITVSHVLTRVLHKIYTKRLMNEIQLDLRQRAFIPADGCAENVMLLQIIMDEAKHSLVPLAMASVDVAKAFDKVTHQAIVHGLRCKGVSDEFCNYIR